MAALVSGNLDAMRAAGVPNDVLRRLAAASAYIKLQNLDRDDSPATQADGRYWRNTPRDPLHSIKRTREREVALKHAQDEFNAAMREAFGDDDAFGASSAPRYAFLPASTRQRILQIESDYDDLRSQLGESVELASDKAKRKLLEQEQQRDVLAAMSADERAAFELRSSATADAVRRSWGDAIQTEEDYIKVYSLQKAFDAEFPRDLYAEGAPEPDVLRRRESASRQLEEDVRAAVGDDNYISLKRANDPDYQTLSALETRLSLPAGTADAIYSSRETYSAQSMAITADSSLSAPERGHRLAALATRAKADLEATLGAEGADAFVERSAWLQMLGRGQAFSVRRQDADPNIYYGNGAPVYPAAVGR